MNDGLHFDDLQRGQTFSDAPSVTVTSGLVAAHQAVVGNRLRVTLDERRASAMTGRAPLVPPGLVWDLAIGQSTVVTQNVRANLFYRGLVLHRHPAVGDTLTTTTTVVGLRQNQRREGRPATGLVALRISTVDDSERTILDFWRCAMVLVRDRSTSAGEGDDLATVGLAAADAQFTAAVADWNVDRPTTTRSGLRVGDAWDVPGGDVVSSAPELARLTLNMAMVHHDARTAGGRRLVYGGHTIGVALTQLSRSLPSMLTVVGWHSCDHTGPVHEGDTLRSRVEVARVEPRTQGGLFAHLRVLVTVDGDTPDEDRNVLDWQPVVLCDS